MINIGVIGTGRMGERHIKSYMSNPNVNLNYIVDQNKVLLNHQKKMFSTNATSQYRDIIENIDAVSIATPSCTHYEIAKYFISEKKHVLLEKPIAANFAEAMHLVELAKKNNTVLAIGHIERFNPVVNYFKELIKEKIPLSIDIHREGPVDSRVFDADVVSDLMIHDIDLLMYLFNEPIEVMSSYGKSFYTAKIDIATTQLFTKNGTLVNITSSRVSKHKHRTWKVTFPDEYIILDFINYTLKRTENSSQYSTQVISFNQEENLLNNEIENFVGSIMTSEKPKVTGLDGANTIRVVNGIQEIMQIHHPETIHA